MRGRMGVSNVPFGDLSVSDDAYDASVAAFFWVSVGVGGR